MLDTSYVSIHHSKYWMAIHYDTTKDEQNKKQNKTKKTHLIFYCLILHYHQ